MQSPAPAQGYAPGGNGAYSDTGKALLSQMGAAQGAGVGVTIHVRVCEDFPVKIALNKCDFLVFSRSQLFAITAVASDGAPAADP